jgi:GTP-binding protein HflX
MKSTSTTSNQRRALLVGVLLDSQADSNSLDELARLADTDGIEVVDRAIQHRHHPDTAYYIGEGKAQEIAAMLQQHNANESLINLVIFDSDLLPAQVRNLENVFNPKDVDDQAEPVRVIDRTELILDIFATHARTRQSKLQVDLAHLEYTLPRLKHMWTHFSRIAGRAMVSRGPGEKQLEVDRRLARDRITRLKREIQNIQERRKREVSTRSDNFSIALVGYTNAGKSTLMNALTGAGVLVEDKLFSTLDTKTHAWALKSGQKVLLSDTVGFIHNLPHHLVASFHATLEEVAVADLLLHVVDSSSCDAEQQIDAVNTVLAQLKCSDKRTIILLNKIDQADPLDLAVLSKKTNGISISALKGTGLDLLDKYIEEVIMAYQLECELKVPLENGKAIAYISAWGRISHQAVTKKYIKFRVRLGPREAYKAIALGAIPSR